MNKILLFLLCAATASTAQIRQGFRIIAPDSTIEMKRRGDTTRVNINRKVVLKKPVITLILPDDDGDLVTLQGANAWEKPQTFSGVQGVERHGPNIITNGTFTTGTAGWAYNSHWALVSGAMRHTPGTIDTLYSVYAVEPNRIYSLRYSAIGATAGSIYARFGGGDSTAYLPYNYEGGLGDHHITRSTDALKIIVSADFNGSIDNVSLRMVPSVSTVDSLGNGLYMWTDWAMDQRISGTKGIWINAFQRKPFSVNYTGVRGSGLYVGPYGAVQINCPTDVYQLNVGGTIYSKRSASDGPIFVAEGTAGDYYALGFDGTGGYLGMGIAKPFTIYGGTSGSMSLSATGTVSITKPTSAGTFFSLVGGGTDQLIFGMDGTGGYIGMANTQPFTIHGGTSGSVSVSALGTLSVIKPTSTGQFLTLTGAGTDQMVHGIDAVGGYIAMANAKPLTFYGGTSGSMTISALGTVSIKKATSAGTFFTLDGGGSDQLVFGVDGTGGYMAMANAKPLTLYGASSGSVTITTGGNLTVTGTGVNNFTGLIQAGPGTSTGAMIQAFHTSGVNPARVISMRDRTYNAYGWDMNVDAAVTGNFLFDRVNAGTVTNAFSIDATSLLTTFNANLTVNGVTRNARSFAGYLYNGVVNYNTAQSSGIYFGEDNTTSTPFYIARYGSTHATKANETDISNVGQINIYAPTVAFTGVINSGQWQATPIQAAYIGAHTHTRSAITDLGLGAGDAVTFLSITTGAPSGGTAVPWKLGSVSSTTPTSPNRTIQVELGGAIYYLSAKTTND